MLLESNRRFRRRLIAGLIFTLIALYAVANFGSIQQLRARRNYVREYPLIAVAAWRADSSESSNGEALVLVQMRRSGWSGSTLEAWLAPVGVRLGLITDTPEPLTPATVLLHVTPQKSASAVNAALTIERRAFDDIKGIGRFVTKGDDLFFISETDADEDEDEADDAVTAEATNLSAAGWHWQEGNFAAIPAEQASQLAREDSRQQRRRLISATIARTNQNIAHNVSNAQAESRGQNNWTSCTGPLYAGFATDANNCVIELGGARWTLNFDGVPNVRAMTNGDFGKSALNLTDAKQNRVETLAHCEGAWIETNAAHYAALRDQRFSQIGREFFGRRFNPYSINKLIGLSIFLCFPYFMLRRALAQSVNTNIYFPDAQPDFFPLLDHAALERYTNQLEALGFARLRDYTVAGNSGNVERPTAFARLFVHRERGCFVELGQIFTATQGQTTRGLQCSIMSSFDGGWTLGSSTREANPVMYLLRRPRSLWISRPNAALDELMAAHFDLCKQMITVFDVHVRCEVTIEAFHKRVMASLFAMKKMMQKRSRLLLPLLIEYWWLKSHRKHYEWLGNYGLIAPARNDAANAPAARTLDDDDASTRDEFSNEASYSYERAQPRVKPAWTGALNFAATMLIGMATFLFLFHPTNSSAALKFRLACGVSGLAFKAFLALASRFLHN